jgi:hypothetical protein
MPGGQKYEERLKSKLKSKSSWRDGDNSGPS